jgi:hypothetical protein
MSSRPLYADRQAIVAAVALSGAVRAQEVAELLDSVLRGREQRAGLAAANARAASSRIAAGIRQAYGDGPVHARRFPITRLVEMVLDRISEDPQRFGLRRLPDACTVRRVIEQILAKPIPLSVAVEDDIGNSGVPQP